MRRFLVSIVIPTRGRPGLLRRAIRSALDQSYQNIEVLVIDDGNRGDAFRVCDEFRDERLRAYGNRCGRGACGSRNTGLELARGDFFTGLDDDDYFHEDRIDILLRAYRKEYSFVASNFLALSENRGEVEFRGERLIALPDLLWGHNCIGGQILSETSKVRTVGGFDESLPAGHDIDLWIRMIERWGAALRIACCLYTADIGHAGPRITTTVKIAKRTQDFIDRHGSKMTRAQRLVNLTRLRKHGNKPYGVPLIASLCFPGSWNYYLKRLARIW